MKWSILQRYGVFSFASLFTLTAFAEPQVPENTERLLQQQTQRQHAQLQQFEAKAPDVSLSVPVAKSR